MAGLGKDRVGLIAMTDNKTDGPLLLIQYGVASAAASHSACN